MAKTFLQIVNDVMTGLRQDQVASIDDNVISRLAALYANQYRKLVEDACMWRVFRHQEQIAFGATDLSKQVTNSTERTRLYKIPGKRVRIYDVTDNLADSTQPKDRIWDLDIDKIREMQENNTTFTFNSTSYVALDIASTGQSVDLHRDGKTTAGRTIQIEAWTPQDNFDADTQGNIVKVPSDPIIYGATYMATQERGEELGIDGGEYKAMFLQSLRDAVSKEEAEQGGWEVEYDAGRHDVLMRQW